MVALYRPSLSDGGRLQEDHHLHRTGICPRAGLRRLFRCEDKSDARPCSRLHLYDGVGHARHCYRRTGYPLIQKTGSELGQQYAVDGKLWRHAGWWRSAADGAAPLWLACGGALSGHVCCLYVHPVGAQQAYQDRGRTKDQGACTSFGLYMVFLPSQHSAATRLSSAFLYGNHRHTLYCPSLSC